MYRSFGRFDVVVTDYRYPSKTIRNGLELIVAIRALDPLQAFVVQTSEKILSAPLGVSLLQKPYQIHRLLKLLKTPTEPERTNRSPRRRWRPHVESARNGYALIE